MNPEQCRLCSNQKNRDIDACTECLMDQMFSIIPNSCTICCAPIEVGHTKCFNCIDFELQKKAFVDDIIPITYGTSNTDISYMIRGIKNYGNTSFIIPLASILYKFLITNIGKMVKKYGNIDYLVYVPSYKDLRNHNKDLIYSVEFDKLDKLDLLVEPKEHQTKQGTNRENRKVENDRYIIDENYDLDGKTFLLFDDLCTSGSTLHSAACTLKQNGADKVIGLVILKQVFKKYIDKINNFTEEHPFSYNDWKYETIQ